MMAIRRRKALFRCLCVCIVLVVVSAIDTNTHDSTSHGAILPQKPLPNPHSPIFAKTVNRLRQSVLGHVTRHSALPTGYRVREKVIHGDAPIPSTIERREDSKVRFQQQSAVDSSHRSVTTERVNSPDIESDHIFTKLIQSYDLTVAPIQLWPEDNVLDVYIRVLNFANINAKDGTFKADFQFFCFWTDRRLKFTAPDPAFPYIILERDDVTKVWTPGPRPVGVSDATVSFEDIAIRESGLLEYRINFVATYFSNQDLAMYPFDKQVFKISVMCTATWNFDYQLRLENEDPALVMSDAPPSEWKLVQKKARISNVSYTDENSGGPSEHYAGFFDFRFDAAFEMKRYVKSYLLTVIFPMATLVLISFFASWLRLGADRIAFATSMVFTAQAYNIAMAEDLPAVGYHTWISVFMVICFFFLCSNILTFAIVWIHTRSMIRQIQKERRQLQEQAASILVKEGAEEPDSPSPLTRASTSNLLDTDIIESPSPTGKLGKKQKQAALREKLYKLGMDEKELPDHLHPVDKYCRWILPGLFLCSLTFLLCTGLLAGTDSEIANALFPKS
eukprot:GILK01003856.1.p1 GENE.GILK01003856.1~~GILK01003856.1.p1  ORF type:complete len:562 (-),score=77.18 GILK01003856.1:366-2051(-)